MYAPLPGKLRRRALVLAGGALLWGGLAAARAEAAPTTHTVMIEQMRFNPPSLTVRRGDRVVWVNKDLFPHTASASARTFDSHSIAPDASWSYVADRPGRYPYLCNFHPTMHGILTVQ
jgi:plastocyanin